MNISPLSFSPVGEMQVTLTIDSLLIIRQQEYLSLPFGGGSVGADDNILSNKFLPFGKARMGYPTGEARWGLIFNTVTDYRFILVFV